MKWYVDGIHRWRRRRKSGREEELLCQEQVGVGHQVYTL